VKSSTSHRTAIKRVLWAFAIGVLYTVGFFVAFRMMWVDLPDKYLALESIIGRTGQALLYTLYAPITFSRLYGSAWGLPFLFLFAFVGSWLLLLLRQRRKDGSSHVT
jgi:hypothetical protein